MLPTDPPSSGSRDDQLNGWKEIAAHLGRSVRAAQRWERELGLPVHRLKTAAGQVVFASRREIDAWRKAIEVPREEPEPAAASAAEAGRPSIWRSWWARGGAAVFLLVVAAAVGVTLQRRNAAPERPVRFQLIGQELEARDGAGRRVWAYRFPADEGPVSAEYVRPILRTLQVADLDNDGRREVVVLVQKGAASNRTTGVETLDVFSEEGRLRWSYVPDVAWTFAGRRFDGPWVVLDLLIAGPRDARQIWVAYAHNTWWPGFVVRIDPRGKASVQFVQSGLVYGLGYWTHAGRSDVLAAGVNNEYASASVAVLDAAGPPAVSPQSAGSAYRCDNCPGGPPAKYFLLPRTELSRLSKLPYNAAVAVGASVSAVQITTEEWDMLVRHTAAMYRLSASLEPESVDLTDAYWEVHRELEASGRIAHTVQACPERTQPKIVREWTGAGWREVEVPVRLALVPGGGAR